MDGKPVTTIVYETVYSDIINGAITTNDILSENKLAERFNVSKAPVREALISLCSEGILQNIPRSGYKVVQILPIEAEELIEMRTVLELYLFDKAWPKIGAVRSNELMEMHTSILSEEKQKTSVMDNWLRNMRFHLLLASYAGNHYMSQQLEKNLMTCARASTQYFLGRKATPVRMDLHLPLINAIQTGNKEEAVRILSSDIRQLL